jgi:tetratricopeptide (TPR) repeat protein
MSRSLGSESSGVVSHRLLALLLCIATLLAFGTVLLDEYSFDDEVVITDNPNIRSLSNLKFLFTREYMDRFAEDRYRPFSTISYFADYALFGPNAFGYHLDSLLLHLGNVLLLYFLLARLTHDRRLAFLTSGLLAVHTISGEAVNALGFREDLQAAFVILLGALATIRYFDTRKSIWCAVSVAMAFCAILTKENAVIYPIVAIALLVGVAGRRFYRDRALTSLMMGILVAFGASLVVRYVLMRMPPTEGDSALPLPKEMLPRLLTILKIQGFYFQSLFYAVPFVADFSRDVFDPTRTLSTYRAMGALVVALLWVAALRDRRVWLAVGFYLLAMGPTSNLVALVNPVAFRFLYFPAIGLYFILAWTILRAMDRFGPVREKAAFVVLSLILIAPAVYSTQWNRHWKNDYALWSYAIEKGQENCRIYTNIAGELLERGEGKAAEIAIGKALAIQPYYYVAWMVQAECQRRSKRFDEAVGSYKKAIDTAPGDSERSKALFGLGFTYQERGDKDNAKSTYEEAVALRNDNLSAHINLAILAMQAGDMETAQRHVKNVESQDPASAAAFYYTMWIQMAEKHRAANRSKEAIDAYRQAIDVAQDPRDRSKALFGLGYLYESQRDVANAKQCYDEAIALDSANTSALLNRAVLAIREGDKALGRRHLEAALEKSSEDTDVLFNLAQLDSDEGRRDEAVRLLEHILRIQPENKMAKEALGKIRPSGK